MTAVILNATMESNLVFSTGQTLIIILMVAIGAMLTRFLPFLLFGKREQHSKLLDYLGKTLPYATSGMLVVYCLKGVKLNLKPYGIPELISVLVIVYIHNKKRNTLLSIGLGTILYMILIRIL